MTNKFNFCCICCRYYIYADSSGNIVGNQFGLQAIIVSGPNSKSGFSNMCFNYNMIGQTMGSLYLEINGVSSTSTSNWTKVWSKSGNQGSGWKNACIPTAALLASVSSGSSVFYYRFRAVLGGYSSDIGLDNISLA